MKNNCLRIFIFISFLSVSLSIYALQPDTVRFQFHEEREYIIQKDPVNNIFSKKNHIIRELALEERKTMSEIAIPLQYTLDISIVKEKLDQCKIELLITGLSISGYQYKGFDIAASLIPERIDLVLALVDDFGLVLQFIEFTGIDLYRGEGYATAGFAFYDPDEIGEIRVQEEAFSYEDNSYGKFNNKLHQVNNYYAAIDITGKLLRTTNDNYFSASGDLWGNYLKRLQIDRIIRHIENYGFPQELGLEQYDPGDFLEKFDLLMRKGLRYQTIFRNQLIKENIISLEPIKSWPDSFVEALDSYYEQRMEVDHNFASFYDSLVCFNMNQSLLSKEFQLLYSGASNARDSIAFSALSRLILKELTNTFIRKAGASIENKMYDRSLRYLLNARWACNFYNSQGACSITDSLISKTVHGIINYHMDVAEKAIFSDMLDMAQDYLDKTLQLSSVAELDREMNDRLEENYKDLMQAYYDRAGKLFVEGNIPGAINSYIMTRDICEQRDLLACPESLALLLEMAVNTEYDYLLNRASLLYQQSDFRKASKLADKASRMEKEYPQMIRLEDHRQNLNMMHHAEMSYHFSKGSKYLSLRHYFVAFRSFAFAKFLQEVYFLPSDPMLDSLLTEVAVPVFYDQIEGVGERIDEKDFEKAETMLIRAETHRKKYLPDHNGEMDRAVNNAWIKLNQDHCVYARKRLQYHKDRSDNFMNAANYDAALNEISLAGDILRDTRGCDLYASSISEQRELLMNVITYQLMISKTIAAFETGEFNNMLEYREVEAFYRNHHLQAAGLEFRPMCDYAMQSRNPDFVSNVLNYCVDEKKYEKSLELLIKAKELGVPANDVNASQQIFGREIALKYYREMPEKNPYIIVNDLTQNNKWFTVFRKSFLKTWETLDGGKEKPFIIF